MMKTWKKLLCSVSFTAALLSGAAAIAQRAPGVASGVLTIDAVATGSTGHEVWDADVYASFNWPDLNASVGFHRDFLRHTSFHGSLETVASKVSAQACSDLQLIRTYAEHIFITQYHGSAGPNGATNWANGTVPKQTYSLDSNGRVHQRYGGC